MVKILIAQFTTIHHYTWGVRTLLGEQYIDIEYLLDILVSVVIIMYFIRKSNKNMRRLTTATSSTSSALALLAFLFFLNVLQVITVTPNTINTHNKVRCCFV